MSKIDDCAEDIIEANTCFRIEAGILCMGSDVAAYCGAQGSASCPSCGEPWLVHTDDEMAGCGESLESL